MPCPTLSEIATLGGAYALEEEDALGTAKERKKADVTLSNIDQPRLTPTQNLINTIVEAVNGYDVTDSIISGRIVMKNRGVLTLDEERMRRKAQIHMEEIVKRMY